MVTVIRTKAGIQVFEGHGFRIECGMTKGTDRIAPSHSTVIVLEQIWSPFFGELEGLLASPTSRHYWL